MAVPPAGWPAIENHYRMTIMIRADGEFRSTRREVVALGIGAFVLAAAPLAVRRRARTVRRTMPVMGSTADIVVLHAGVDRAEMAIDAAMTELRRVERTMSRFRDDSDIGRVNRGAARESVAIGEETSEVIALGLAWARATDGAFDPAIGRVVELWDIPHRHEPPPESARMRLAGRQFHRAVEMARENGVPTVHLATDDVHIDLGGIAAGYGVDRAVEALRAHGIQHALINLSGDIYAMGLNADDAPWRIGIRSPDDADSLIATVDATDCAVATSGDYEQFFRYRGVRYHHLMDPDSAAPSRLPVHTATVRATRCVDADAGSTAAFVMGRERAAAALAARDVGIVNEE